MTPKELEEKLKEIGFDKGKWGGLEGKEMEIPLVGPLKPLLLQARKIVSLELKGKIEERHRLHEVLGKLKHGGAM